MGKPRREDRERGKETKEKTYQSVEEEEGVTGLAAEATPSESAPGEAAFITGTVTLESLARAMNVILERVSPLPSAMEKVNSELRELNAKFTAMEARSESLEDRLQIHENATTVALERLDMQQEQLDAQIRRHNLRLPGIKMDAPYREPEGKKAVAAMLREALKLEDHFVLDIDIISRFGSNKLGNAGVSVLCAILKETDCNINTLNLGENYLTHACAQKLCTTLSVSRTLVSLSLNDNSFTEETVPFVVHLLKTCTTLSFLDVNGNGFGDKGRKRLKQQVKKIESERPFWLWL